ncbi:MAG: 2-C-methyl-D-erythritol 4-phosphate cytidylyltransferase [Clostridia bacterium]|nr:2-C-methyl-D-erythritol 4-phosphate cytidylyltransferase [Clostridia bacterium]
MNIAILLAGGVGARVGAEIPKQFIEVEGKPIMVYTLETFQKNEQIEEIILVCVENWLEKARYYCEKFNISKLKTIVAGGTEFIDSCINGLEAANPQEDDLIVITSVDRPLISNEEIDDSIRVCQEHGSGVAARKCSLCMFKVGSDTTKSKEYLRDGLVQTATPWTFKYSKLKNAIDRYLNKDFVCESYPVAIYAAAGNEVHFSKALPQNFKITEKYDVKMFEEIIKEGNKKQNDKN